MKFAEDLDLFGEIKEGFGRNARVPDLRAQHLYPSGASITYTDNNGDTKVVGGCMRKQFLQYKQEPSSDAGYITEDIGPAAVGNLLQDYVEDELFKKADLFLQSELQIYLPQWNVSGRADTILRKREEVVKIKRVNDLGETEEGYSLTKNLREGDTVVGEMEERQKLYGVEVKSKDGYFAEKSYIRANKTGNMTDFRPADEHIIQSMIYLYAFQNIPELKRFDINTWFVFYVLRGDGKYNYFKIEMTDHNSKHGYGYPIIYSYAKPEGFVYTRFNFSDVIKRWEELNFCIEHTIVPNRDYELVYSVQTLQNKLNNNDPFLSVANKKLIASGQYNQVITGKGTVNERALGDFECYACPYKSKCWGLENRVAEDFDCLHNSTGADNVKYSEFNPFTSDYFDKVSKETQDSIREELGDDK